MKKVQYELFIITIIAAGAILASTLPGVMIPSAHADVPAAAHGASYLFDHSRGWFWYERIPEKKKVEKKKKKKEETFTFPPISLADERIQLKVLKERAVWNPTEKNITAYIRLQNWVMDQASTFAVNWKKVIWTHPDLDFSLAHPTNAQGIFIEHDQTDLLNHQRIAALGKSYGLFFIFESFCPYCQREAPMLKQFSRRYGISIIAISKDGVGLPDFPNPKPDTGISAQLHAQAVPALFLVNPKRRIIIPLAYGLISEEELVRRIITMTTPAAQARIQGRNRYTHGGYK